MAVETVMSSGRTIRYLIPIACLALVLSTSFEIHAQSHAKDSLVVSFISIGAGTDYKAKERLDLFVKDFQSNQQVQLAVRTKHWGKEGETDYTYDLSKLSRKQCKTFVEEIEAMFSGNDLVRISHHLVD